MSLTKMIHRNVLKNNTNKTDTQKSGSQIIHKNQTHKKPQILSTKMRPTKIINKIETHKNDPQKSNSKNLQK